MAPLLNVLATLSVDPTPMLCDSQLKSLGSAAFLVSVDTRAHLHSTYIQMHILIFKQCLFTSQIKF